MSQIFKNITTKIQFRSKAFNDIYIFIDIDECRSSTLNNCQQTCTNVNGTYQCSCPAGFILKSDNRSCEGNYRAFFCYLLM